MYPCLVCEGPTKTAGDMCPACCRSYDRMNQKDSTMYALIDWAAKRARAALRKRLRTKRDSGITGGPQDSSAGKAQNSRASVTRAVTRPSDRCRG